jgi:hypothetical protein
MMRKQFDAKIEAGRLIDGHYASRRGEPFGAFKVLGPNGRDLLIIASDGIDPDKKLAGWEHVSVSIQGNRPPNWQEMNWVKEQFWDDDETVLQFHPKRSLYVNIHPNCLHLWRQLGIDHPLPPQLLV